VSGKDSYQLTFGICLRLGLELGLGSASIYGLGIVLVRVKVRARLVCRLVRMSHYLSISAKYLVFMLPFCFC